MVNGILTAAVLAALAATGSCSPDYMGYETRTVSLKSRPIRTRYGEVHNAYQEPMDLPADIVEMFSGGKTMAMVNHKIDIVDEEGNQVPLFQSYNHHYGVMFGDKNFTADAWDSWKGNTYGAWQGHGDPTEFTLHPYSDADLGDEIPAASNRRSLQSHGDRMADVLRRHRNAGSFGGGQGAEMRHLNQTSPDGYAYFINSPEQWMPLAHFINTNTPPGHEEKPLWQCPCTPQRVFDVENGTIDGNLVWPPFGICNSQLEESGNPSCSMETYVGGFRCCENGVFLIDTDETDVDELPVDTVYALFTITYVVGKDANELGLKPLKLVQMDVSGSTEAKGNFEYDVPQCPAGTPPEECIYEVETVQYWDGESIHAPAGDLEIPFIGGHLHVGGIWIEMYNNQTGELICHSDAIYGNGTSPGDEKGFLVGMDPCVFTEENVPRMARKDKVRIVARYNATVPRTGVMGQFLSDGYAVPVDRLSMLANFLG